MRAILVLLDLRILTPDPALLRQKDETGLRWSYDPDGCCEMRKVLPLSAALAGFDAQFTGRKAFQSSTRRALPRFEIEDGRLNGRAGTRWNVVSITQSHRSGMAATILFFRAASV